MSQIGIFSKRFLGALVCGFVLKATVANAQTSVAVAAPPPSEPMYANWSLKCQTASFSTVSSKAIAGVECASYAQVKANAVSFCGIRGESFVQATYLYACVQQSDGSWKAPASVTSAPKYESMKFTCSDGIAHSSGAGCAPFGDLSYLAARECAARGASFNVSGLVAGALCQSPSLPQAPAPIFNANNLQFASGGGTLDVPNVQIPVTGYVYWYVKNKENLDSAEAKAFLQAKAKEVIDSKCKNLGENSNSVKTAGNQINVYQNFYGFGLVANAITEVSRATSVTNQYVKNATTGAYELVPTELISIKYSAICRR